MAMNGIRRLTDDDWQNSMSLSQFAFQYQLPEEEIAKRKKQSPLDQQWGYFVEGNLAAKMTILPLTTWISGKRYTMGGLAGVATWPEYRRQGMVGQLLHHALQYMKDQGQTVSYLHPFQFGFYRKYGWEHCMDYKMYDIPVTMLKMTDTTMGQGKKVVRYGREIKPLLNGIYSTWASRYNGTLERSEDWWENRVFDRKPGQIAVLADEGSGQPEGYILYEVKNRTMTIHEMVSLNEGARQGLWSFVSNHDSMVNNIILSSVPTDDTLAYWLANPRVKQEVVPYFMARIVDVEGFVEQYAFEPSEREDTLWIRVTDEHALWNEGSYRLVIGQNGEGHAAKMSSPDAAELNCDIQTLTAMLMGQMRPRQLQEAGRLQGEMAAVERLEERISRRTTYLPDFF
jgi:predicted acetyltransferase